MAQTAELSGVRAGLSTLPQRIILADGWTRRAIAFAAGAFGTLALPPFDFAPAMAVPMTAAVWLIDGAAIQGARFSLAPIRSAAAAGWWLGFGYFLASLWWLGAAMLVEADQFAWAIPLAVIGLPTALALFPALGFALSRLLWSSGSLRIFALAAGLGASEWLRGHILTGFPWNDFGMALAEAGPFGQAASLVGLHGLDLLAIVIFAAPATIVDRRPGQRFLSNAAAWTAAFLLLTLSAYGALRLATSGTEYVDGVALRLMQPNLPQDAKFKPENGQEILRRYLALSDRATGPGHTGVSDVTHLIWPESAFPYVLSREPQAVAAISRALQGKILITGAARVEADGSGRRGKIYNSIEVLQGDRFLAFYDKTHLVPFGEYLPLEGLLRPLGVSHLVPGVWDRGQGPRTLAAPGLPQIAPLICYEAIFPGEAAPRDKGGARPQLLLNLTNDGWFGKTIGPYQHFAQARLRAVEEGLPLIRVANTGISAIVDAYGRVIDSLPLGEEGIIDGRLPKAAGETIFARWGGGPFVVLWALFLLLALAGRWRG
ncbi:apolipoprotein N-acyltransferase [Methylocystis parvus]|uniref:Apolipoprotein N-acyltransferase n=1 Tax=Methylocystis parvus TaxID=134 RepID=A0A6B8MAS5_9HYPH|nr:apolipoprotein N-acyltransferase [Methylocystis parvus]QGM98679.1 apolipoprotein N-acyltransferase [Methylocystis parvus]WBK00974.1 apolipoprotein N-acyltransferase [Methylocystis parvus OBBP]